MKNYQIINLLFITTSLFSVSCTANDAGTAESTAAPKTVAVYKITEEEIRREIEGFGNLSFRRKADITSAVDGTIKDIRVEEGDTVNEGRVIALLYNIQLNIRKEQAEAALISAESAHELAETQYREGRLQVESRLISIEKSELNLSQKELELEHQRGLLENKKELLSIGGTTEEEAAAMELAFKALETEVEILRKDLQIQRIGFRDEDILSCGYNLPAGSDERKRILIDINSLTLKSELKVAEARVKSASTELESAQALLDETRLSSPLDGIVGAKYMERGERIKTDGKLFTIFDSSKVDLVFAVPEEIGVMLSPGQTVKLSLDAVRERNFSAVIRQISPTIDTRSGNITVKAELDNDEDLFRPGMFSRFSLTYGPPRKVTRIPVEALVRKDGSRGLVMKAEGGRAYPMSIVIDSENNGMHELVSGIGDGELIILNPSPLLQEGDRIDVR